MSILEPYSEDICPRYRVWPLNCPPKFWRILGKIGHHIVKTNVLAIGMAIQLVSRGETLSVLFKRCVWYIAKTKFRRYISVWYIFSQLLLPLLFSSFLLPLSLFVPFSLLYPFLLGVVPFSVLLSSSMEKGEFPFFNYFFNYVILINLFDKCFTCFGLFSNGLGFDFFLSVICGPNSVIWVLLWLWCL